MAGTHDESLKTTEAGTDPPTTLPANSLPTTTLSVTRSHRWRRWLFNLAIIAGLVVGGYFLYPVVETMLNTVSTDDAYVNGHVTFVAPRVSGQVSRVLVDDNYRVKKGALLVQLDKEPFADQVAVKQAAVAAAEADLVAAQAQVRGLVAQARANRFQLEHAIEDVHTQIANLRANIATLKSQAGEPWSWRGPTSNGARSSCRAEASARKISTSGARRSRSMRRHVDQALQAVYATRVGLGLPAQPPKGHDLSEVPADLDQNFSAVRQALGQLIHSAAQLGYAPPSWDATPKQAIEIFLKLDPQGNLDRIYATLIPQAPAIKQAEAKLHQARRDLDAGQAQPPLLRRRQRDRRRGDPPQRQPRQQRPGGAEPDGGPLAHGDLDRCQLQGDSTGGPAHRPSGALRSGHVRQPA